MRVFVTAVAAAALLASNAFAADLSAPLAPGKPAGLHQAQASDTTFLYILGGAAVIAGIALVVSSSNGGNNSGSGGGAPSGSSGSSP